MRAFEWSGARFPRLVCLVRFAQMGRPPRHGRQRGISDEAPGSTSGEPIGGGRRVPIGSGEQIGRGRRAPTGFGEPIGRGRRAPIGSGEPIGRGRRAPIGSGEPIGGGRPLSIASGGLNPGWLGVDVEARALDTEIFVRHSAAHTAAATDCAAPACSAKRDPCTGSVSFAGPGSIFSARSTSCDRSTSRVSAFVPLPSS